MAVAATYCLFCNAGPLLLVVLCLSFLTGADKLYPNSYTTEDDVPLSTAADLTSLPVEIHLSEGVIPEEPPPSVREITRRSADPIVARTTGIDNLLTLKNVADHIDSNDVELSSKAAHLIHPSRTLKAPQQPHKLVQTELHYGVSGEAKGAPQGRAVELREPHDNIDPTATTIRHFATLSHLQGSPRQVNPDIQDIITGIVKLLNGKVNVQANTALPHGRPMRPLSSRINNRGPPRITELPALPPDFDLPAPPLPPPPLGQMPPPPPPPLITHSKMPTPYPFDIPPPQNTSPIRPPHPMRDKIIPLGGNKRPGFYRPMTIPPWPRPNTNRRPPQFPPYKPMRIPDDAEVSITSDKPAEDILTLDLGTELEPSMIKEEGVTNPANETELTTPEFIEEETDSTKIEKLVEDSKLPPSSSASEIEPTNVSANIVPTVMQDDDLVADDNANDTDVSSSPIIESSIQDVLQTLKLDLLSPTTSMVNTPTEGLPDLVPSTSMETPSSDLPTQIPSETNATSFPYYSYRPRPGIVLDDTEYKPGRRPIVTARPSIGHLDDIFDVTVSAIQGPGQSASAQGKPYIIPVDIENVHLSPNADVITSPLGSEGFVSIDGKRTYLNLFGEQTESPSVHIAPTPTTNNVVTGTGYAVVDVEKKTEGDIKPTPRRPTFNRRPSQPPVRIDTCIVGDDSTCDVSQHEICRTEAGVSACHCSPGHARRKHRDPCRKIVSILLSLRVDKLYERRVVWASELGDGSSSSFQQLSYETERALESAMSMTPFSDEFLGVKVNSIYRGDRAAGQAGVFVNLTLQLEENSVTARPAVRADIQKHLLGVIQRRGNNVGNSALWVDSPPGSVSNLQDLDECASPALHDCHALAKCINIFGGFKCECGEGYRDPWLDNRHRSGRHCEQCSPQYCGNRGECKYQNGQEVCICSGNYYGNQCELDGEVLGVAIGASVAAIIIIVLTLVCLVMWSRRWNKEQKATVGSPVFGYMAATGSSVKTPVVGAPPYQLTLEDRLRWAQIADVMAQANHYAPEPVTGPTRPSSAVFGYPNASLHGTLQHRPGTVHGTLPPIPMPRLGLQAQLAAARASSLHGMRPLDNSSSSEEEDKTDLLGRSFQVPRPKSRSNASIANQSGIYYDVDYDQQDIYSKMGTGIPLSTYAVGRPPYYRN